MAKRHQRRPPPSAADECGGVPPPILSSFPSPSPSPSPSSSSSSSSDFEFTVSLSPTSRSSSSHLCPADDLFYKGQLLPLHLSPRLHMVRTLILSSSSSSSTSTSRDSSSSSADSTSSLSATDLLLLPPAPDCDSSRPSSATDDDTAITAASLPRPRPKYLSSIATKFSAVFHRSKKEQSAVKEVLKKCVRKVKPLYDKISSLQHHHHDHPHRKKTFSFSIRRDPNKKTFTTCSKPEPVLDVAHNDKSGQLSTGRDIYNQSFSGNLRYPRRNRCTAAASCPSSTRSSPSHSGLLAGVNATALFRHNHSFSSSASIEELQSAIQGAIAHCKSTMKKETPVGGEQI